MANKIKLINLILLSNVVIFYPLWAERMKPAEYEKYVDEIINEFSIEMERDYSLICIGSGGKMPYDVEEIKVKLQVYRPATLEEARKLEVKVTQRLMEKINQNMKIRPFLHQYPVEPFRAEVSISFLNDKDQWYANSIAYIFQVKNTIYYFKQDPLKKDSMIEVHSEPFQEAEKIVEQNPPHGFKGKKT